MSLKDFESNKILHKSKFFQRNPSFERKDHIENGIDTVCITWISFISNEKYFLLFFIWFWFEFYKYYKHYKHVIYFVEIFKFQKKLTFWPSWKKIYCSNSQSLYDSWPFFYARTITDISLTLFRCMKHDISLIIETFQQDLKLLKYVL